MRVNTAMRQPLRARAGRGALRGFCEEALGVGVGGEGERGTSWAGRRREGCRWAGKGRGGRCKEVGERWRRGDRVAQRKAERGRDKETRESEREVEVEREGMEEGVKDKGDERQER